MLLLLFVSLTSSSVPPFFVDCTAQLCERVCPFKWLSFQYDRVIVLCGGFHDLCLASVDVESKMC